RSHAVLFSGHPALPPLPSFPTRRSSDLRQAAERPPWRIPPVSRAPAGRQDHRRRRLPLPRVRARPLHGERGARLKLRVGRRGGRSEEHTSELQSLAYLVCRRLPEKEKFV